MTRRIVKVLAAVFALSLISATGASAATMDPGSINYASKLQASGSAFTHLAPGPNDYPTYARVAFRQAFYTRTSRHAGWHWRDLGERQTPTTHLHGTAHYAVPASGPLDRYQARYSICIAIPQKVDPCFIGEWKSF